MVRWSSAVEGELKSAATRLMAENDRAHSYEHVTQVVNNAKYLMEGTECQPEILIPAAYFHDLVSRLSSGGYSSAVAGSALLAGKQLAKMAFCERQIRRIQSCIRTAAWEHAALGGNPDSIEAYILRDADLLEAMGAHGIARVFSFAGSAGLPSTWIDVDFDKPHRLSPHLDRADPSPFYHFLSKLLWLQELIYSQRAQREAERRHRFLFDFLHEYRRELEWHRQAKE